jgi:hypothetical protein
VYTFVPFLPKQNNQPSVVEAIAVSVSVTVSVAVSVTVTVSVAVQRESPKPDTRHEARKAHDFVAYNSYRPSTLFLSPASSRLI